MRLSEETNGKRSPNKSINQASNLVKMQYSKLVEIPIKPAIAWLFFPIMRKEFEGFNFYREGVSVQKEEGVYIVKDGVPSIRGQVGCLWIGKGGFRKQRGSVLGQEEASAK